MSQTTNRQLLQHARHLDNDIIQPIRDDVTVRRRHRRRHVTMATLPTRRAAVKRQQAERVATSGSRLRHVTRTSAD